VISNQLKDFVCNFPSLDYGERKLLIESLIERVEIGQKKRVTALLRPPFAFGSFSPELAPRVAKAKPDQAFVVRVVYSLLTYYGEGDGRVTEVKSEYSEPIYLL
jgi:hypothetical protein